MTNSTHTVEETVAAEPIKMILHCPKCGLQHIDEAEEPRRLPNGNVAHGCEMCDGEDECTCPGHEPRWWTNPPHRSHLCHGCGCIWRPADVPTEGVRSIETKGKADTWTPSALASHSTPAGEDDTCLICGKTRARHNMGAGVPTCPGVAVPTFRSAKAARSTHDELVEALAGCEGLESGPNGSSGMRVVAHFPVGSEHALFDLLNAALTKMGEKL